MAPGTSSLIRNASSELARTAASRISRRSFLGGVGKYGLLLATAGGIIGISADPAASALPCDCAHGSCTAGCSGDRGNPGCGRGNSITCRGLTGQGGVCPTNTSACGLNRPGNGGGSIAWKGRWSHGNQPVPEEVPARGS